MKARVWIVLATGLLTAGSLADQPCSAQPVAEEPDETRGSSVLHGQIIELNLRLLKARARLDEMNEERARLDAIPKEQTGDSGSASQQLFELAVPQELLASAKQALDKLERMTSEASRDSLQAERAWKEAMSVKLRLFERQAELSRQAASGARAGNSQAGRWTLQGMLFLGFAMVASGLVLTLHEVRGWFRREVRGLVSRAGRRLLLLVLAVTLVSGTSRAGQAEPASRPETPRADPTQQREQLERELRGVETELARVEEDLDNRQARYVTTRLTPAIEPVTREQQDRVRDLCTREEVLRKRYRDLMATVRTTQALIRQTKEIDRQISIENEAYQANLDALSARWMQESLWRLVACGLFTLGTILPLTLVRLQRRRVRLEQSRKCPRCLAQDTLQAISPAEPTVAVVPGIATIACSLCKYEIRQSFLRQDRLCFPTVGIRASGKTHWMLVVYDLIKNSHVPVAADVQKIPSREDDRFEQLARRVFRDRGRPAPSVLNLPYPLTFLVQDADRLGRNQAMINLFDYAGELRDLKIDLDPFRRRALLSEGFTFFLDPTQVYSGSGFDLEDQIQTLEEFATDLHSMHETPMGQPIRLPVAVCISKFDLLVSQNPMGSKAGNLVAELRKSFGCKPDLAMIHHRSQLCSRALPLMFPGWNAEAALRSHFGGRYMLFPISSIGLEETEQGCDDHTARTIAPFGVLEPLLWLLHMRGYTIFR